MGSQGGIDLFRLDGKKERIWEFQTDEVEVAFLDDGEGQDGVVEVDRISGAGKEDVGVIGLEHFGQIHQTHESKRQGGRSQPHPRVVRACRKDCVCECAMNRGVIRLELKKIWVFEDEEVSVGGWLIPRVPGQTDCLCCF